jgi:hypothetical protein
MNFALPKPSARIRCRSIRAALLFVIMIVAFAAHASAATNEAEARALFTKFVAAQNAHSVSDVKAMLWNSPGMLFQVREKSTSRVWAVTTSAAPTIALAAPSRYTAA